MFQPYSHIRRLFFVESKTVSCLGVNKGKIARNPVLEQMALGKLSKVLAYDYKGPRITFNEVHVIKAIMTIGKSEFVGRGKLASLLNMGQGEVRTLIRRLREEELIVIGTSGCELTNEGREEYNSIMKIVPWSANVSAERLGIGPHCWAAIVRGRSKKVRLGIEQRDAAIRAGALGAVTVIFASGRFRIPSEWTDCEKVSPGEPWESIRKFQPKEGDVVIISGADDPLTAEYGGWAGVLTLI
jgi:predicted transcriptional regulator